MKIERRVAKGHRLDNGKTIADFPKKKMEQSKLGIRMNLLERNKKAMKTYVRKHCIDSIIDNMLGG